jgi:hypothetical protein
MTPIDVLVAIPLLALITFIWASLQTEEIDGPKSYKRTNPDLWIEKPVKIKKPKYPEISKPVIPDDAAKG